MAVTDRNTEGILRHIQDYLAVREQQASRINPRIAHVIHDVAWSQVENLRHTLQRIKVIGGEKFRVADILVGDDDQKRRALLSTSDNNSLVPEIVNRADDQRRADLAIHDMRTLFRAIDPSLENVVQLIQHWILWDLPDAADLFHFDEQVRRLETLLGMEITEDLRNRYRMAMRRAPTDVLTDEEILQVEFKRLAIIGQRVLTRRTEEEAYQMIIRRDELSGSAFQLALLRTSGHLERLQALEQNAAGALDERLVAQYAEALDCAPHEVTPERAADYERRAFQEAKAALKSSFEDGRALGDPYNYKEAQAAELRTRQETMQQRIAEYLSRAKEQTAEVVLEESSGSVEAPQEAFSISSTPQSAAEPALTAAPAPVTPPPPPQAPGPPPIPTM